MAVECGRTNRLQSAGPLRPSPRVRSLRAGPDLEFDVVILAGDIHSPAKRAVQWAVDRFRGKPVVYLLGNHEYYDGRLDTTLAEARRGS